MSSNYIGVKYYSKTDMSLGFNLEKAEKIINSYDEKFTESNINYILELHNIYLIFNSKIKLERWSEEYYEELKLIVRKFRSEVGRFFSKMDYLKIESFYPEISVSYIDTFWKLFEKYKIYKKVSPDQFLNILKKFDIPLNIILEKKR